MPETNFSWADQIENAKKAGEVFTPLDPGTYNFEVTEATSKTFENSGDTVLSYKAKVLDGPRANHTQFDNLDPFAPADKAFKIKLFLDFFTAVGLNPETLIQSNPTLDQIAQAVNGRKFTADVVYSKKKDRNGNPYINLANYRPLGAPAPSGNGGGQGQGQGQAQPQAQPAATGFGDPAPAPAAQNFGGQPAATPSFGDQAAGQGGSVPQDPWSAL